MPELSADERRYLLAAFAVTPLHWFRAQVVGRRAELSARDTDELLASLVRTGLMDADPQHCARLTDLGRAAATEMLGPREKPYHHQSPRRWVLPACACGIAFSLLGMWWLVRVL